MEMKRRSDGATKRRRGSPSARRGFALMDVIVGGIMLGIGLAVVMSISARALQRQTDGEKRMVAAWLADELLNMVIVAGPDKYSQLHDTGGVFDPPFDEFVYDVSLKDQGLGFPYEVAATVRWPRGEVRVDTYIAVRKGDPEQPREPLEPLDREARYFEEDYE